MFAILSSIIFAILDGNIVKILDRSIVLKNNAVTPLV